MLFMIIYIKPFVQVNGITWFDTIYQTTFKVNLSTMSKYYSIIVQAHQEFALRIDIKIIEIRMHYRNVLIKYTREHLCFRNVSSNKLAILKIDL